jgi:uncharacterized membrane protein (DUF485 family)
VQVLDLAIFLPAIFITGISLLRKKTLGNILTPVLLTFFILMDITIAFLVMIMKQKGIEADVSVAVVMAVLALLSAILLTWFLKAAKQ